MLSEDVATEMRGRSAEVEMFPLSFSEFLTFNGIFPAPPSLPDAPRTRGRLKKALSDYMDVGGFPDNDAERGFLLENAVFMALRRGFNKIEYYNTKKGEEVDFFVTDKVTDKAWLVQVSYEMADEKTRGREFAALLAARRETGIDDCTIVTWDEEGEEDGVRIVPAWKWLLS
jgi:predicted AAA+ superfamily ATPase